MVRRGGATISDVHVHINQAHRIIFVSFIKNRKMIGAKVMIGDFLTRYSFERCAIFIAHILGSAGYVLVQETITPDTHFLINRLPKEFHDSKLKHKGLPIKLIDLACRPNARAITIKYYVTDPEGKETPDKKILIEWDKYEITQIPTMIDFEFLASTVRQLFLFQENYVEVLNEPKFNRSFPDHFVFEYNRKKSALV